MQRANRDRLDKPQLAQAGTENEEDEASRENYIYMRETGLLWSSTVLAHRLRQPPSNRPVPFSKVYVCDFELDFVSKDDTEVLLRPMRELKELNQSLQADFDSLVTDYEKLQESEYELTQRAEETRKALASEQEQAQLLRARLQESQGHGQAMQDEISQLKA